MIRILLGHVLDRLAELPDESVQCVVTSPPYYGLRDYGIEPQVWGGAAECAHEWDAEQTAFRAPYGADLVNRSGCSMGTKKREGETVSQGNFCRYCAAWRGSLGLEPTLNLYLDHLVTVCRQIRRVLRKDGTFWLNIGDSYNAYNGGAGPGSKLSRTQSDQRPRLSTGFGLQNKALKPKDLMLVPARLAIRMQEDGWYVRSEIVWAKDAPMPESVTDRPTCAHEKIFLLTKSARYFYDAGPVKENFADVRQAADGAKIGRVRNVGGRADGYSTPSGWVPNGHTGRNQRNVWRLPPSPYPDAHFATFPPELPRRCILAGSKPCDTILDPFAGAGTTLLAADQLQRHAIGIELNPQYAAMAQYRVSNDAPLLTTVLASYNANSHNAQPQLL